MKFSVDSQELLVALLRIAQPHPSTAMNNREMHIKVQTDGVVFTANQTSAFVPAHVGVAGACLAPRAFLTKYFMTYPRSQPVKFEVIDGRLCIDWMRIPVRNSFVSRENDLYHL